MIKIPEKEIRKRFQRLHNYEKIRYPQLKERSDRLRKEIKALKKKNKQLQKENKQIEKLQLQLEELRILKFGKKRANMKTQAKSLPKTSKPSKKRSAKSYRRPEPNQDQITDHLRLELKKCPECGAVLTDKKEHTHYREDLHDVEDLIKSAKKIVETIIESGKCPSCGKRQFAMEVPKQKVLIGENIRRMVVYQTVIQGQSYTEVKRSLKHQYGINLSNGEIANVLEGESRLLTPYYNHIVDELEKESASHYDETSWNTISQGKEVSEGNFCWVKIGVESQNRLIWFGRSRGKGVAEQLRGEKEGSIGVSDDYAAYKNLFEYHQLCWAHPNRKLRDLAESGNLKGKSKQACKQAYKDFGKAYKKSEFARKKLKAKVWTDDVKIKERAKLEKLFDIVLVPNPDDPEKLKTIRESLKKNKEKYFTFFKFPYLSLDNNKGERAIRKVVLKRKKSFGCKSQKGADVLSILYSVIFSITETYPDENFFSLYKKIVNFDED